MNFILDSKYTKILKAFANAHGLKHRVQYCKREYHSRISLEVNVFLENRYFQSALDVFKHGQIAYVSSMREYTPDAQEDHVEYFSQKIINGLIGEGRYIKSLKGGDGYMVIDGQLQFVNKWTMECPVTIEKLFMQIDLAGIDWQKCNVEIQLLRD